MPKVYKIEKIEEVVTFANEHGVNHAYKKFSINPQTIKQWIIKYDDHGKFRKQNILDNEVIILKKNNSKYPYNLKKIAVNSYQKYGLVKTMQKLELTETTLLRWVKKDREGTLKPKYIGYRYEFSLPDLNRYTKVNLIRELKKIDLQNYINQTLFLSTVSRYRIIYGCKQSGFSIKDLCFMNSVSKSGYYNWIKKGMPSERSVDENLGEILIYIRKEYGYQCGARTIKRHIFEEMNLIYSVTKINRHLNIFDLQTVMSRGKKKYNISNRNDHKSYPLVNLLMKDNFKFKENNDVWVTDATWIIERGPYNRRPLKLFCIMDLNSRYILSFSFSNDRENVPIHQKMLKECLKKYGPPKYFHSDRGSEYRAHDTINILLEKGVKVSFSDPHAPTQNAHIESFHKTLKRENKWFKGQSYYSAKKSLIEWIYKYNNERYHTSIKSRPFEIYKGMEWKIDLEKNEK